MLRSTSDVAMLKILFALSVFAGDAAGTGVYRVPFGTLEVLWTERHVAVGARLQPLGLAFPVQAVARSHSAVVDLRQVQPGRDLVELIIKKEMRKSIYSSGFLPTICLGPTPQSNRTW